MLRLLLLLTLTQTIFGFVHKDGPYIIGNRVTPDASAMFQVETIEKGYLVPRLTTLQRDAIASPAEGLQLYNTDVNALQVFAGGAWGSIGGGGSDHPLWTTTTGYGLGAIVLDALTWKIYRCNTVHTSDAALFATDLALGYWDELSDDLDRLTVSVDETLPRFDGTTGGLIQSSGVTISDTDAVGNVAGLAIGSAATVASSIMDTTSTTQGTRPCPLMTEVQRDAIGTPANGLCIFNTTTDKLNIYSTTATAWVSAGGGLDKWETAKDYKIDDVIWDPTSLKIYVATADHTSGATFIGDIANWDELSPATFDTTFFDAANEINGPVTHLGTLQKAYSHITSSGISDGGDLTDNLDGTVSIASLSGTLRMSADSHANVLHINVAASGVLALTDATANYLYIDYNAGTPQWVVSTSETATNGLDKVLGYIVARRGNILKIIDTRNSAVDFPNRAGALFKDFGTFLHKEGGSILGASGLNVTVTAGRFWYGVNPIPHDAFDTSIAGTAPANVFTSIYGAYTITDDVKLLDNVNYDNAGTLTALGTGKWKVDWLYMVNDTPSTLALIYGDAQYNNKANAELASAPVGLPPALEGVGTLIGRYLIQEGVAGAEAQSVFTTTFTAATVTNHNDLATLQGGTVDEYYHLTSAEHTIATQPATNLVEGYVSIIAQSWAGVKTFIDDIIMSVDSVFYSDDGTVTLPPITTNGDANTGIYFPAADSVGVTTGGTQKLLVNENVEITDNNGTHISRKERKVLAQEDFVKTNPDVVFVDTVATGVMTISTETVTPLIEGSRSLKIEQTSCTTNDTFTMDSTYEFNVTEEMHIHRTLGIEYLTRFNGISDNIYAKLEFYNGANWTTLEGAELGIKNGDNPNMIEFNLPETATKIRIGGRIATPNDADVLYMDDFAIISNPFTTKEFVLTETYRTSDALGLGSVATKVPYYKTTPDKNTMSELGFITNDSTNGLLNVK